MERKKTGLLIIGVCVFALSVIGVTYAFWQIQDVQETEDKIASSCFDVKMENEQNAIKISKGFPILDSDGEKLTPYKFTITNKCDTNAKYQINLESVNKIDASTTIEEGNRLNAQYLKVKLNEENKGGSIHLLNEQEVDHTLKDAYEAYRLTIGYLGPNESKNYELRLWLNGNLTMEDTGAMNKTYAGKISVTATYSKNKYDTLVDTILTLTKKADNSGEDGLYEIKHDTAEISYTTDPLYIERLQQTELRYAGTKPDNYVWFNSNEGCTVEGNIDGKHCELWRIIGLVNTPEGQRIKLVKDASIGYYSWDSSEEEINGGQGVNEWSQSDLMTLLNVYYYNSMESRHCFCNWNNGWKECNFSNVGIQYSKGLIDTVTWNTGAVKNGSTLEYYNMERSKNNNTYADNVLRHDTWNGNIGLIYPSDYGYATSGGTKGRNTCFQESLSNWHIGDNQTQCAYNDWLRPSVVANGSTAWLLSPIEKSLETSLSSVSAFADVGYATYNYAYKPYQVKPSVYLKPDVLVSSGNGSQDNPYVLEY